MIELFESVPNFSEGRRQDVIEVIASAASKAFVLDVDADADHNRLVLSVAGSRSGLLEALLATVGAATDRIDLREHSGVHPRVGAVDVVPIVPLGATTMERAREAAHELGERIWEQMRVPVYFYGRSEGVSLADIRAGRASLSLGGPDLHPTAGAVCVGARHLLVAFNVILFDADLVGARALAKSIRESAAGLRGVQALAFELPGPRIQLSMNLFRLDETTPADVLTELHRRGVAVGAEEFVGLSPAAAASPAADGKLLEGRLASAAAGTGADRSAEIETEEHRALSRRLRRESVELGALAADQDSILGGAERAAAMTRVLGAAGVLDAELEALLAVAASGLRAAVSPATQALYSARLDALDARLA